MWLFDCQIAVKVIVNKSILLCSQQTSSHALHTNMHLHIHAQIQPSPTIVCCSNLC